MSTLNRIREIVAILESRHYPVPVSVFLEELEISRSTFKRDLDILRDQMQAPIEWRPGEGGKERGYVLADKGWASGKMGLPRAWFTASEIYALLMIDELASHIGPGILTEHIQPLITRITLALSAAEDAPEDVRSRIQILASASRRKPAIHFEAVAQATVKRKRLEIVYFTRSRNEHTRRAISPQRLIHYKENWYLIAWCHKSEAIRNFSLDAIEEALLQKESAQIVAKKRVDESIGKDFGIFSGGVRKWAKLRFSPLQARWVESEVWHEDQKSALLDDGSLLLEIPYSDHRELVMDILRFGCEVEVLSPPELRAEIVLRLKKSVEMYE